MCIPSEAVRFVFGPLIQKELDQFTTEWNNHRVRHSKMAEVPNGVPDVLYSLPCLHGKLSMIIK